MNDDKDNISVCMVGNLFEDEQRDDWWYKYNDYILFIAGTIMAVVAIIAYIIKCIQLGNPVTIDGMYQMIRTEQSFHYGLLFALITLWGANMVQLYKNIKLRLVNIENNTRALMFRDFLSERLEDFDEDFFVEEIDVDNNWSEETTSDNEI